MQLNKFNKIEVICMYMRNNKKELIGIHSVFKHKVRAEKMLKKYNSYYEDVSYFLKKETTQYIHFPFKHGEDEFQVKTSTSCGTLILDTKRI